MTTYKKIKNTSELPKVPGTTVLLGAKATTDKLELYVPRPGDQVFYVESLGAKVVFSPSPETPEEKKR